MSPMLQESGRASGQTSAAGLAPPVRDRRQMLRRKLTVPWAGRGLTPCSLLRLGCNLCSGAEERVELVLEARKTAAAVEQLLTAAGPGGMGLRVDVEVQRVALGAVGGARGVF